MRAARLTRGADVQVVVLVLVVWPAAADGVDVRDDGDAVAETGERGMTSTDEAGNRRR